MIGEKNLWSLYWISFNTGFAAWHFQQGGYYVYLMPVHLLCVGLAVLALFKKPPVWSEMS